MSSKLTLHSTLPLHNSHTIPRLGFGVYLSPPTTCTTSCLTALRTGYRHIDTAQYYDNEASVGTAIAQSTIPRADLFITTKILSPAGSVEKSYQSVRESVDRLAGKEGYVDLFLIHSPNSGSEKRREMWMALEKLQDEGRARSIGVSNWGIAHLEELRGYARTWPPAVNQIELHPFSQQRDIVTFCHANHIVVQAYSPLVRNTQADDPTLLRIARSYHKSTPQVLVRYALQKNWVPLPKSDTPARIVENADVFDFVLSERDMSDLDALDRGEEGAIVQVVDNVRV